MVITDTIEGIVDNTVRYHYDRSADVLYLRLLEHEETDTYADPNDEGDLVLLHSQTDEPVGLTVISWWKRAGKGDQPDSITEFERLIEPWAQRVAARGKP
jgi:hypothetical protein